jgi:hypothetical protein
MTLAVVPIVCREYGNLPLLFLYFLKEIGMPLSGNRKESRRKGQRVGKFERMGLSLSPVYI